MNIISLQHVTKIFDLGESKVYALRDVSFDIEQGGCVAIVGPSGSGKTTCMNMIGCLDRPTTGNVFIDGKDTATLKDNELAYLRNKTIGFVFQQYFLLPGFTVLENVMLPLRYQGIPVSERKYLAMEQLDKVGLSDRLKHRPNELSGGQKQRAAIARALVTKPQVILADEPTGALDTETGESVLDLFLEINKTGTALVVVTHNMELAQKARRCIHIRDGVVTEDILQDTFQAV